MGHAENLFFLFFREQTFSLSLSWSDRYDFLAKNLENLMNKAIKSLVGCALMGALAFAAHAAEDASATLTSLSGSGPFTYALTLTDSGSTTIGSVWFAWKPGFNYLPSVPSSAPSQTTGWGTSIQGTTGAASVQFTAGSSASYLQPGQSATFDFTTADSPSTLAGDSGSTPIGTSVAYSAGLFSDGGVQFVATSTPEPSSWALLAATAAGWLALRRHRAAVPAV